MLNKKEKKHDLNLMITFKSALFSSFTIFWGFISYIVFIYINPTKCIFVHFSASTLIHIAGILFAPILCSEIYKCRNRLFLVIFVANLYYFWCKFVLYLVQIVLYLVQICIIFGANFYHIWCKFALYLGQMCIIFGANLSSQFKIQCQKCILNW